MYQAFIVFVFIAFLIGMTTESARRQNTNYHTSFSITAGQNINDYGGFVSNWSKSNKTFTGTVSDATLALPTWVSHPGYISNYVVTGTTYIYYVPQSGFASNQLVTFLSSKGNTAGINSSGILYNGATNVGTVPAAVPNGAVVLKL